MAAGAGQHDRTGFDGVIDLLVDADATATDRVLARMVFDTVSAALLAALGTDAADDDVLAAARRATVALAAALSG